MVGEDSGKDLRKERDLKRDWEGTAKAEKWEVGHLVTHFPRPTLGEHLPTPYPIKWSQHRPFPLYCFKALF